MDSLAIYTSAHSLPAFLQAFFSCGPPIPIESSFSRPGQYHFIDEATNGTEPQSCHLALYLSLLVSVLSSSQLIDRLAARWRNYSISEDALVLSHVLFKRMGSNTISSLPHLRQN